jgi:glucose-6-phosphate dehydrogenase assembly protein OpcA
LISQELSPAINPGALDSINEVLIEHGPHAVTQAWQLAGWLASRLGWKTQATKFKQGQEIAFQILGPHGPLRLKLDRLPDGPSQIQRVRFACSIAGKAGALDFVASENCRLSVQAEGVEAAPRTVTVKPQSIAELVARQLSDREPDSVFRDAMMAAHPMAYSLSH